MVEYFDLAQTSLNFGYTLGAATPAQVITSVYDTSGNGGRKLVQLSNGWLVALCIFQNGGNTSTVYWNVSKDNGVTWNVLCYWNYINGGTLYGAMVTTGTIVYSLIGYSNNVYNQFFSFDATTVSGLLSGPKSNPDTGQSSFGSGMSLAIDSIGTLHAAWCSKNSTYPNSNNIRYSKSTDGGNSWAPATQNTTTNLSGWDCSGVSIVVKPNGYPLIVWAYGGSSTANVQCIRASYYDGTTWQGTSSTPITVFQVTSTSYFQNRTCALVDGAGNIHVVWDGADGTSTSNNIKYSKSMDGGNTWSAMVNLSTPTTNAQYSPSIVCDGSNDLYVLYHGTYSSGLNTIRQVTYLGGAWGSPQNLIPSGAANAYQYPQALFTSDGVLRYIYQNNVDGQINYDASVRPTKLFSTKPAELKIPLWWADGSSANDSVMTVGTNFLQDGGTSTATTNGSATKLHTLSLNWPIGTKFALEVTLSTSNATYGASAQLYDMTSTPSAVSGSSVTTTNTTSTVLRSGQFTLTSGHTYGVSIWNANTYAAYISDASLIVFPS